MLLGSPRYRSSGTGMPGALAFPQCLPSSWNRRLALLPREGGIAALSFRLDKEGRVPQPAPQLLLPPFTPPCTGVRL